MAFDKHGEGQLGRSAEGDGGGAMSSMFHILHGDMLCTCTCTKIETCCYHDNIVINTLMCLYIAVDVHVHVHVHVSICRPGSSSSSSWKQVSSHCHQSRGAES